MSETNVSTKLKTKGLVVNIDGNGIQVPCVFDTNDDDVNLAKLNALYKSQDKAVELISMGPPYIVNKQSMHLVDRNPDLNINFTSNPLSTYYWNCEEWKLL